MEDLHAALERVGDELPIGPSVSPPAEHEAATTPHDAETVAAALSKPPLSESTGAAYAPTQASGSVPSIPPKEVSAREEPEPDEEPLPTAAALEAPNAPPSRRSTLAWALGATATLALLATLGWASLSDAPTTAADSTTNANADADAASDSDSDAASDTATAPTPADTARDRPRPRIPRGWSITVRNEQRAAVDVTFVCGSLTRHVQAPAHGQARARLRGETCQVRCESVARPCCPPTVHEGEGSFAVR